MLTFKPKSLSDLLQSGGPWLDAAQKWLRANIAAGRVRRAATDDRLYGLTTARLEELAAYVAAAVYQDTRNKEQRENYENQIATQKKAIADLTQDHTALYEEFMAVWEISSSLATQLDIIRHRVKTFFLTSPVRKPERERMRHELPRRDEIIAVIDCIEALESWLLTALQKTERG